MKHLFLHITLFFSLVCFSQNEQLAQYYYDKGDFEKAKISYEELLENLPQNTQYFLRTIDCYQQLQQFYVAEKAIQTRLDKYKQGNLLVELGYNFQLQKNDAKAKIYYEQALDRIKKNPNEVYGISNSFEKKVLLEYALKSYQTATELESNFNFNYQIGLLYGQLGNQEMMITTFLNEAYANPQNSMLIQNQLARFMVDEGDANFSETLRKALIVRAQKNQDVFWNRYLSWFYVQQKEFEKAFIQEKAIYKRDPESLSNIVNLGQLAIEEDNQEAAKEILGFVLENTKDLELLIQANSYLIKMKIEKAKEKEYAVINTELEGLLKQYEISPFTLSLQLIQAHFVAFNLKKPEEGRAIVKKALELQLDDYEVAQAKMELADILLYEEKFNQALIYYSQIELDLKNDIVAHEASLKAAKTSYFKTDFAWALKQFKELKSANTQLIANDALEYFLLINDNMVADSTQTALKQFAKGDYLLYQNRNQEAVTQFQTILKTYKGQEIEAVTLLRLGKIYAKLGDFTLALSQYQNIIDKHSDGIYIDEALYFSAEIYNKKLQQPEKAKPLYEKIIFSHEDSIYFVEARKKFRQLRGDTNL
ncbi:tetratricopeptide repeat protein [Flavobacterium gawalongense]|uniref:Tetratricopeptide repeat protein n=1 Tax=Flavobacterium gawalongense TaxID=2594432 RepID=A0A553BW82_9FLAO|nr:tetratricopeptide repeat protein [Flavobacterium gawalongense]TRX02060.1 tetratricopeptide repeat protein [Flavobacterium gawalongense]TRX06588.1 tetratricopeptide repeat protein [Flavobacterium gawalongense]TRX12483.1 tetratricopeptide repeat protein [Flavobacterium gawalongense]TRX12696.1 tetratricopeptide repeat protein [Flavobacterium gawalongense]TRX30515.1 tetratricopeptide repeat protein [Flavobacterium gawalongense]